MRLGLIIYGSLNQQTGGYLYDRKVVQYLQAQGDRIEVISLPWRNYVFHLGDNLSPALFRMLVKLNVDLLIEDELNHPSLAGLNYLLHCRKGYPVISIVHHLRYNEVRRIWQRSIYRFIEELYLKSLDGLICNSKTTLESAQAILPLKIANSIPSVIAYPGKDHLTGLVNEQEIESRSMQNEHLRLLFLGNLIPRKGLHWLLAALSRLRDIPLRLHVVGDESRDPHYARQLHQFVERSFLQEQIQFWGSVDEYTLQELLRQAHIMVVPSSYEGFGIAYLEGMSYGLVVIGSREGGARELISDGIEGFLIEPGNVSALANRLWELHIDRERLAQMGIAARKRYEQHPTWSESAEKIRQFLLCIIS
ncbi:MAG: glycosyltransferase family 4 protein [Anaerolineales bacterium]|nr:glycosyltransferase family 4 protein [Anaerolineales bacterium]